MTSNDKKLLNDLRQQADEALKAARGARLEVTAAYARCAAGQGTGPTVEQIDKADHLEAASDDLWRKLNAALSFIAL